MLFSKVRKYENKYRTKNCDFTVYVHIFLVPVRDGAEGKIQTNGLLTSHHHGTESEIIIGKAVKRSRNENRLRSKEKSKRENLYRI